MPLTLACWFCSRDGDTPEQSLMYLIAQAAEAADGSIVASGFLSMFDTNGDGVLDKEERAYNLSVHT